MLNVDCVSVPEVLKFKEMSIIILERDYNMA